MSPFQYVVQFVKEEWQNILFFSLVVLILTLFSW